MDAYQKIMVDVIKKSRVAMLRSEVVWIVKSTELINFIVNLIDLEVKFKNIVLKTYHNDAEKTLNDTYEKFKTDSLKTVCCLKNIRGTVNCRLKMSHGSPNNSSALQVLLVDMNQANKKCADILNKSYTEIELKTIVSEYTNKFPLGVLKAATLSFDLNTLQNKIKQITYRTSSINQISEFDIKQHDGTSFSYTVSTAKQNLVKAIESFKQNSMTKSGIIVVRRENSEYWNNNVQKFSDLHIKRFEDIKTFYAVEKSKLINWATCFVQNVKEIKTFFECT
ncbi:uncharacterized protein LOC126904168 [Daktulosphaira vitifoliae]|uniref:uncharacterized protein LOC126904168 n=1 Tax=Daktulosphaira vitifoliae TaxID=58002 RepID=UPI0021A9ED15|nr:uncharacterized protein LOC126904168 [Daktulosphaira vitifoliae]